MSIAENNIFFWQDGRFNKRIKNTQEFPCIKSIEWKGNVDESQWARQSDFNTDTGLEALQTGVQYKIELNLKFSSKLIEPFKA